MDTRESSPSGHPTTTDPATRAGDPFAYAGSRSECSLCFGGHLTITVEEDGQERDEAVPCSRCSDSR